MKKDTTSTALKKRFKNKHKMFKVHVLVPTVLDLIIEKSAVEIFRATLRSLKLLIRLDVFGVRKHTAGLVALFAINILETWEILRCF